MPDGSGNAVTTGPWDQNWSVPNSQPGGQQPGPWDQDWSTPTSQTSQTSQTQPAGPWEQNWATTTPPDQASQDADAASRSDIPGVSSLPSVPSTSFEDVGKSLGAGLTSGAVTTAGSALAGPGTAIQASVASGEANARRQLDVMDRIDRGETVPSEQDPLGYQYLSPDQRTQLRQQYSGQIAQMPPPGQTTAEQVGKAVATPGVWVNAQGQKITPPEGYENSVSNTVGKALGSVPVILGAMWATGGPLGAISVTGSQTFHDAYTDDIKNGVAPEDAATNAGLKALVAGGAMAAPIASWAETLSGLAKRAFVAVATRAVVDGFVLTSVSQAQQLTNNAIDKATIAPDKSLTEGVGNPKELLAQFLAGMAPGVTGKAVEHVTGLSDGEPAARTQQGGPGGPGEGAAAPAEGAQPGGVQERSGDQGTAAGSAPATEGPVSAAPAPAADQVQAGISLPQDAIEQGHTLVRATDSSGTNWVGHGGVLVAEGTNPQVDAQFRDAEQRQPGATQGPEKIDDLVSAAHTNATQGITWTGTTQAPDGRTVVQGHDAEGHAVEVPEDRYAVLAQYGDPARDMYLHTRPGEPPVVAVRDPRNGAVTAIGQGRAPLEEPITPGHTTLEDQDAALEARVPRTQRQPGITSPNITDRPSLYRQAFRDAGYDPDVMVNRPVGEQLKVLSNHIENTFGFKVAVDPKMQPQKAIDSMLDGYRNMQWMAHALGYPLPAMSLNGKLNLNLEPFKPTKTYLGLYSYDPATGQHTIHMPDRSNSFAHEWTHALDHELVTKLAVNPTARGMLTSGRAREGALDITAHPPGNSTEAFANVMRAIFHDQADEAARLANLNAQAQGTGPAAQRAAAEAQRIMAGARARAPVQETEFAGGARRTRSSYLMMPEELLARAHEAYVAHTVKEAGGGNEFITKGDQAYLNKATHSFENLYPQGADRDNIFRAFQELHAQLLRENTLGRGPGAGRPGDYDMLDPIHWGNVGTPGANPAVTAGLRAAVTRASNWRQRQLEGIAERAGVSTADVRGMASKKAILGVKDAVTPLVHSNMGQLDVYRERYGRDGNKAAARIIDNVMDKLGWRYGENRFQQTPFERLAIQLHQEAINKTDAIMNRNGISTARINQEQQRQLFDALRGRDAQGNIPNVPDNIRRAAGEIRGVLNDTWYKTEQAGIPIGFPRDEGYLPIVMDDHRIRLDGSKATGVFEDAMHADFDAKQRTTNNAFIHEAYNDLPRSALPRDVHDAMSDLAKVQEAMRQEKDPTKLAALDAQQKALLARAEGPIRDQWAAKRAGDMSLAIDDVPWLRRGRDAGTGTNPLRSRVLSAEARDKLIDAGYVVTKPNELLPHYFRVMGRRIASARLFGPNEEYLVRTMDDLRRAGVSYEDRQEIESSIESAMGRLRSNEISQGHRMGTWARSLATMILLGRATFSTVHEPLVSYAQSGSGKVAIQSFGTAMQALMKELNLMKGSDRVQHLSDIAKFLGITSTRLSEAMLQGRFESFGWAPGQTMAALFRRTGLTQITNANKIGTIQGAHTFMKLLARQILDNKRGTLFDPAGEYRELGIPNAQHKEFASYMDKLDHIPTLDEIANTPMGQLWGEAVRRFDGKVVLEPTAAEKPRAANSGLGRFVYGLMSYNYNFMRAVLNPAMERRARAIEYEQHRLGNKAAGYAVGTAKWAAYAAAAVGTMMAVSLPVSMIRQEIFDHERANQWRADGTYADNIIGLALQRTGVGGIMDPVINTLTGLKYDHDISSLALGAQANFWVQSLMDMAGPWTGAGSPNTNTAAYRGWRGAYRMFAMPVAALATALLPGGPKASWAISALGQYLTSMSAAEQFATMMEGPKGEKTNLTPQQREAARQAQMFRRPMTLAEQQAKQKTESGGMPSSGLLGLLDDFAVPAVRTGARVLSRWVR